VLGGSDRQCVARVAADDPAGAARGGVLGQRPVADQLADGGLIEPVTAAAISRLGQRVTCALQDQTESWLASNGGHRLADNQRRGLAGTGGRFFETPNAWDPIEQSVAQLTYEAKSPGVFKTYRPPPAGSVRNKRERDKVLRHEYGDAVIERGGWIDIDRIHAEIEALLEHDPAQAERWFMNRCQASEGAAFDLERFKKLQHPGGRRPEGSIIVIGVDGARHHDALAMVATDVKTGFQWPLCIIERPDDAGDEYEHDQDGSRMARWWRRWSATWCGASTSTRSTSTLGGEVVEPVRPEAGGGVVDVPAAADRVGGPRVRAGDRRRGRVARRERDVRRHVGNARKRMLTVKDDKERLMHTLSKDSVRSLGRSTRRWRRWCRGRRVLTRLSSVSCRLRSARLSRWRMSRCGRGGRRVRCLR
jgi:hypothetical protein